MYLYIVETDQYLRLLDREFLNPNEALIISSEETVLIDNKFLN